MNQNVEAPIRLKCELPGRFMTAEGCEYDCATLDVSPVEIELKAEYAPPRGEIIVAYIRDLGRIEGVVAHATGQGFALTVSGSQRRMEMLADKIGWLRQNGHEEPAERRSGRRVLDEGMAILRGRDGGGEQLIALIDVSETGVSFRANGCRVGERVEIDGRKAVVTRLFNGGAAASFIR